MRPRWSPSCDKVAFIRYELPLYGDSRLCIYDINEGTFTDLTNAAPAPFVYDWSPDGKWIAYQSNNNWGLYIIRPDGSENVLVYNPGIGSTGGSFSPSGEKIVFISTDGAMVADISNPHNIKYYLLPGFEDEEDTGRWDGPPLWGPDGKYIARRRVYEDNFNFTVLTRLYVINPETGDEGKWELLLEMPVEEGIFYHCDWSPDGRYLLLSLTLHSGYECFELCAYELDTGVFTRITYSNEYSRIEGGSNWGKNGGIIFEVFDYKKKKDNPDGPWRIIYTINAPP